MKGTRGLVTGHADRHVTFHNPSGHTPEAVVATLPMPVFDRFAAHRGISLYLSLTRVTAAAMRRGGCRVSEAPAQRRRVVSCSMCDSFSGLRTA
jgi:hypothetical protein